MGGGSYNLSKRGYGASTLLIRHIESQITSDKTDDSSVTSQLSDGLRALQDLGHLCPCSSVVTSPADLQRLGPVCHGDKCGRNMVTKQLCAVNNYFSLHKKMYITRPEYGALSFLVCSSRQTELSLYLLLSLSLSPLRPHSLSLSFSPSLFLPTQSYVIEVWMRIRRISQRQGIEGETMCVCTCERRRVCV